MEKFLTAFDRILMAMTYIIVAGMFSVSFYYSWRWISAGDSIPAASWGTLFWVLIAATCWESRRRLEAYRVAARVSRLEHALNMRELYPEADSPAQSTGPWIARIKAKRQ